MDRIEQLMRELQETCNKENVILVAEVQDQNNTKRAMTTGCGDPIGVALALNDLTLRLKKDGVPVELAKKLAAECDCPNCRAKKSERDGSPVEMADVMSMLSQFLN